MALISLFPVSASAQYSSREDSICKNKVNSVQVDSLVLNSFSSSFYYSKNALERNYDFELLNKQRKLRMWSNEISVWGYVSIFVVMGLGGWAAVDRPWSLLITIPLEVIVCGGIIIGSSIWANNLMEKAAAIHEFSVSIIDINNSDLFISHYSMDRNYNLGLGIGYKYNF